MDRNDGTGAAYVFGVKVLLRPETPGVWTDPDTVETTVYRSADPPGETGWLFFRDNLWRGELADPEGFRTTVEAALDAPVETVDFRELRRARELQRRLDDRGPLEVPGQFDLGDRRRLIDSPGSNDPTGADERQSARRCPEAT